MPVSVSSAYEKLQAIVDSKPEEVLPTPEAISKSTATIITSLPKSGLGEAATESHILKDLTAGFHGQKTSANYYGFVTGGVLPIAEVADNIVTAFDQNAAVHLPDQSISTNIEDAALRMLLELLDLGDHWGGKVFTTGATASNILGLACGREAVIKSRLRAAGVDAGVGELGLLTACLKANVKEIRVLTTMGHSSLYKAAAVVGLGRASVKDLPLSEIEPWKLDLEKLENELRLSAEGVASIVAISAGEVNTGKFATDGISTMKKIRELCDQYGAWLHVDAAFGLFARVLPQTAEFQMLRELVSGVELADSITGDGHKMLNVPYDCGFFFTRSSAVLSSVFQNPNAAYLATDPSAIPSPLNIGLENSRRFRALPVYSTLVAYGAAGYSEMFARQVNLARAVTKFIQESDSYEWLVEDDTQGLESVHIIVLFRAKDWKLNAELVKNINRTRKIYVSGTQWKGQPACRIAVSTWKVDVERDFQVIIDVLKAALTL